MAYCVAPALWTPLEVGMCVSRRSSPSALDMDP